MKRILKIISCGLCILVFLMAFAPTGFARMDDGSKVPATGCTWSLSQDSQPKADNIANQSISMEVGQKDIIYLGFCYPYEEAIVQEEVMEVGQITYNGTFFHDGDGGYYFVASRGAVIWTLRDGSDCLKLNMGSFHAYIEAIGTGTAVLDFSITIKHLVLEHGVLYDKNETVTERATVTVNVVDELEAGDGGSGSDTSPHPDDSTIEVPDDYYFANIPQINIATEDKTILTNKTCNLALDKSKSFTLALQSNIWQEGTIAASNKTISAYFSEDSYGNLFYLQVDTISWQVSGNTSSVSKTSGTGGSFTLTGKQSGTVTLTATAPCSYLVRDGERWVDQGIAGIASASTTIQVAQGEQYHNPFANASEDVEVPFADLDSKAWYAPFVKALAAAGFYVGCDFSTSFDGSAVLGAAGTGTSGGVGSGGSTSSGSSGSAGTATKKINFNASTAENRANTVAIFYNGHKAIGGSVGSYTKNPFWDVSSSCSYYQPVLWGSAQKVVKGFGQGTFGPARGITREQFCTILLRYADYAGIPLSASKSAKTFTDGGSISSWAKDAVVACQKAGIINGYPDGSFRPQNGITRAEVSKMIYMFFNAIS